MRTTNDDDPDEIEKEDDEDGEDYDEESDDETGGVHEPYNPEGKWTVLERPESVPRDIKEGAMIATYFMESDLTPVSGWYTGTVTKVNRRKTVQDNVSVLYADGESTFLATEEGYGISNAWVLLTPVPEDHGQVMAVEEDSDGDSQLETEMGIET